MEYRVLFLIFYLLTSCENSTTTVDSRSGSSTVDNSSSPMNWWDAQYWCHNLVKTGNSSYGGKSDWRLPTQKELMDAYSHGIFDLNESSIGNLNNIFWSSSQASTTMVNAWNANLSNGTTSTCTKVSENSVLCVH